MSLAMPTYHYRCETCDASFDVVQSFSDDALKRCPGKRSGLGPPECTNPGKGKVAKVFSAPGITFKGSGFYRNDSRSGSGGNGSSKSSSSSSSDSGSGSGSETASSSSTKESSSSSDSSTSSSKTSDS